MLLLTQLFIHKNIKMENTNECNEKTCGDQMIIKSIILVPIPKPTFHGFEINELMSMIQMKINLFHVYNVRSPEFILIHMNMYKFIKKQYDGLMKIPSPENPKSIRMFGIQIVRTRDVSETYIGII